MTVAKELKRMTAPVIVDINKETGQLPPLVAKAYREAGGAMPIVILADPGLTKIYGTYSHPQLKGQNYRDIFRDAKRAISADIKEKTFNITLEKPGRSGEKTATTTATAATTPASPGVEKPVPTVKKDIIKIDNPTMKSWKSSRGSTIEAKLVEVEDKKTFVLVTSGGQTLRVTGDQLSLTFLNEARKLAGLE